MFDPWAAALDALFLSPLGADATYAAADADPIGIRVIRSQPSADDGPSGLQVIVDRNSFDIRKSEVASPVRGAIIAVGEERFRINSGAMLDAEGLTWKCPTEPLP